MLAAGQRFAAENGSMELQRMEPKNHRLYLFSYVADCVVYSQLHHAMSLDIVTDHCPLSEVCDCIMSSLLAPKISFIAMHAFSVALPRAGG